MGTTVDVVIPRFKDNKKIFQMLTKLIDYELVSVNFCYCFLIPELFGSNAVCTNGVIITLQKNSKKEYIELNPYANLGIPVRFIRRRKEVKNLDEFDNIIELSRQKFQLNLKNGVDIILDNLKININYDPSIYSDMIFIRTSLKNQSRLF